jgi:tetratricopeptide (TPR) repeat protein
MPKIAITILISLFLFGNMGLAQQINGDSIKSLLPGTPANTLLYAQRIQEISKYYRRINPDSAIYLADISLNIGLALNDHTIINTAKFLKANVLSDRHNQKEARALYDEALSEFKIANNQKMLMQTMNNYGATYNRENNFTEGPQWFQKSMQIANAINDVRGQAAVLGNTGFIEEMTGNKQGGIELYMQALKLCEQAGDWVSVQVRA